LNPHSRSSHRLPAHAPALLRPALIVVAALAFGLAVDASASAAANPICSGGEYRGFDFWIGDWDTFDLEQPDSKASIARNHVDPILDGCVLREDYDQADGHHGQSFTIYDAARKVWHQSWVTNRGELLVLEGSRRGKRITLEGDNVTAKGGRQRMRVFWEPQGADVRETATVSDDGGKTWRPLFDIVFRKQTT
jgi:hypothetical protein